MIGGAIGVRPEGAGISVVARRLVEGVLLDGGEQPRISGGNLVRARTRTREGERHRDDDKVGTDPL